jgi:hypothetical protein
MAIIRIKRSSTSGAPTSLLPGELAYSSLGGLYNNGGDRLYIGVGESDGDTSAIDTIGGKYFVNLADHQPGVLTASSAIIVDSDKKIDNLIVDNIDLNGNTISTSTGNLTFAPTGDVDANSNKIINVAQPAADQDAATKKYVDDLIGGDALRLNVFTDSGAGNTFSIVLADSALGIIGGAGLDIRNDSANSIVIGMSETGVDSATYGSTTAIPVLKVNRFGRIDSAGSVNIATTLTVVDDAAATQDIDLLSENLTIAGGTGLTSTASTNTITVDLDNTAVTPGSYGSGTAIPTFTVDQQGRLTAASSTSISTSLDIADNQGSPNTDTVDLLTDTLTFAASGPTGAFTSTVSNNQVTYSVATASTSQIGVASFASADFAVTSGEVTIANGGVSNAQLENSSVTILGNALALGGSLDFNTDSVPEGSTNLYFTDARARSAISVTDAGGDGSLSYNSGTGVITYTGPSAAEVRAHLSGGLGVTYNSGTGVISLPQEIDSAANVVFNTITATGSVVVSGNLQVEGTTTTISAQNLEVTDNMIYMNAGESAGSPTASIDLGFAGNYNEGGSYAHAGLFRDATDQKWKFYQGYTPEPDSGLEIDVNHGSFQLANVVVNNLEATTLSGEYLGFDSDLGTKSLDDISEGSTKLFYTSARADSDARNAISVTASTGLSYTPATGVLAGVTATTSGTKGVASFSSADFSISSGEVSITSLSNAQLDNSSVVIGATTVNLGDTITDLSGITSLAVDNVTINGNSITTTDANGNLLLTPDGAGKVVVKNLYLDSAGAGAQIGEYIQDTVFNMFSNDGDAIDLSYNDGTGVITIAAQKASVSALGVAQFDSDNFDVDGNGLVTIDTIDGGTY